MVGVSMGEGEGGLEGRGDRFSLGTGTSSGAVRVCRTGLRSRVGGLPDLYCDPSSHPASIPHSPH